MKLVPVYGKALCKIVERIGFEQIRQTGSHIRYAHPDGRKTTIPVHGNEQLGKGLMLEILKQIKITRDDFERLRN